MSEPSPTAAPERAAAPADAVQMPNPPARRPRLRPGHSKQLAEQSAQRAVAEGKFDPAHVEAVPGELPYESVRATQADEEKAAVVGERLEARATGAALLAGAERGDHVSPAAGTWGRRVLARGEKGVAAEVQRRKKDRDALAQMHTEAEAVLAGTARYADGTQRAGQPIAPGTKRFRLHIALSIVAGITPLLVPLLVEGTAVGGNIKAYLRVDDGDWLLPAMIAVIAVGILTLVPYATGIAVNKMAHGARLARPHLIALSAAACVWLVVGITLALVRVSVDRQGAIRAAEAGRLRDIETAQALGTTTPDVPPVDPNAVFDPTLPTIFWIAVFLGLGISLVLWEVTFYNPARLHELRLRAALQDAEDGIIAITDHEAELAGSILLQRDVNDGTSLMWDAESDAIEAAARADIAVHHEALTFASGDPAMAIAIEQHKSLLFERDAVARISNPDPVGVDAPSGDAVVPPAAVAREGGRL